MLVGLINEVARERVRDGLRRAEARRRVGRPTWARRAQVGPEGDRSAARATGARV